MPGCLTSSLHVTQRIYGRFLYFRWQGQTIWKIQHNAVVSSHSMLQRSPLYIEGIVVYMQEWIKCPCTHLCWGPQASLLHDRTPQLLYVQACWELKKLVTWRGFCPFCQVSSPLLCNLEPGPVEMSEGGTWHGTLPFLQSLENQWKDFFCRQTTLDHKKKQEKGQEYSSVCFLPFLIFVHSWQVNVLVPQTNSGKQTNHSTIITGVKKIIFFRNGNQSTKIPPRTYTGWNPPSPTRSQIDEYLVVNVHDST